MPQFPLNDMKNIYHATLLFNFLIHYFIDDKFFNNNNNNNNNNYIWNERHKHQLNSRKKINIGCF